MSTWENEFEREYSEFLQKYPYITPLKNTVKWADLFTKPSPIIKDEVFENYMLDQMSGRIKWTEAN